MSLQVPLKVNFSSTTTFPCQLFGDQSSVNFSHPNHNLLIVIVLKVISDGSSSGSSRPTKGRCSSLYQLDCRLVAWVRWVGLHMQTFKTICSSDFHVSQNKNQVSCDVYILAPLQSLFSSVLWNYFMINYNQVNKILSHLWDLG